MNSTQIIGAIMLATGKQVPLVAMEHGYSKAAFYNAAKGLSKSASLRKIIEGICADVVQIRWPEPAKEGK